MLGFGYLVDRFGRKAGMFSASGIIIIFTALSAGAYGANGSVKGMLQALIAYRCLSGIGIGGEYPSGSVSSRKVRRDIPRPGVKLICFETKTVKRRKKRESIPRSSIFFSDCQPTLLSILDSLSLPC